MNAISLFLVFATLLVGAGIVWWRFLPSAEGVLVLAPGHHANQRQVEASTVSCDFLSPPRQEEREYARFWIGCSDPAKTPDGSLWVYSWMGREDGRAFSTPHRPLDSEESKRWSR